MSPVSQRWRVQAEILLWRHGWAWPMAIIALALASALQVVVLARAQQQARIAVGELERARKFHNQRSSTPKQPAHSDAPWRSLPAIGPGEAVARMLQLAQAQGLTLQQSDYHQQPLPALQAMQVQITQPLKATYPQLRGYIESVLREIPQASLDQVSARRDTVAQGQLETRLRWTLWLPAGREIGTTGVRP
jgi:hypothetical protein